MAGQGTVGLEIMKDVPQATDIILSIGGGGLAGGVSTAVKAIKPDIKVWGVETVGADAMSQAIAAGRPVELPAITSIAKTLGAPHVTERPSICGRRSPMLLPGSNTTNQKAASFSTHLTTR